MQQRKGQNRKGKLQELQYLIQEHTRQLLTSSVHLRNEDEDQRKMVQDLATLMARGRGIISFELEEPQIEEPIRAMLQLRNLGRALARVHGRTSMTDHELELLQRVALSSIPDRRARVLSLLPGQPDGLTVSDCAVGIGKNEETARLVLNDLVKLKLLERTGKKDIVYHPVPQLRDVLMRPIQLLNHGLDLTCLGRVG